MGPQSTVPYYMNIVYGVQNRTSPDFFPNLTIESLNVFEILKMIGEERYDELTEHVLTAIRNLQNAGADFAAMTANTVPIVYDRVARRSPIPLVSIVESTAREAERCGAKRVALLGTRFTMERDFYRMPFERIGIDVVVPSEAERRYIDGKITGELEYGTVTEETRRRFVDIIGRLKADKGAEAVILGCTELPLLLDDSVSPLPVLDTVRIHSDELVDRILSE